MHPHHFYGVHADFDPRHHHGVDNLVDMGLQRNDVIASIRDAGGDGTVQEEAEELFFNGCEDGPEHMMLEQFPRVYDHAHELEDIRRNSPTGASL